MLTHGQCRHFLRRSEVTEWGLCTHPRANAGRRRQRMERACASVCLCAFFQRRMPEEVAR